MQSRRQRPQSRSANVVWQPEALTHEDRVEALALRGGTIWFTGLPAAGKTTLAGAVERRLVEEGHLAYRLDGDNLRHGLNGDLGFTPEDRAENVRRTAYAACLLADSGVLALVALISPYAADRRLAREVHDRAGLPFVEVFVDTPLDVCEERDPKGLYARARRGELRGLTGVGAPYELPVDPEVTIAPAPLQAQVEELAAVLAHRNLLVPLAASTSS